MFLLIIIQEKGRVFVSYQSEPLLAFLDLFSSSRGIPLFVNGTTELSVICHTFQTIYSINSILFHSSLLFPLITIINEIVCRFVFFFASTHLCFFLSYSCWCCLLNFHLEFSTFIFCLLWSFVWCVQCSFT